MLSNVSGIKGENITKTIQATSYAFDLLNETESNAGQVTENIGNILTKVSQNMRYDFQAGIVGLNDAIRTSGSVAKESGMSLEQYSAYMGALIERTGKTGSELGTFWKMLTARVQQIKAVGDEVGISKDDMGNAEKALTSIGVSIRGQNGSLRDMDSILQSVNSKWGSLSDQERSQVAEGVAGNRHRATFLSLMRSMTTEQKLYNDAMNSSGSLEEANEKRAESFQGKLNTLKTTFNQLSATMINSKLLSGGIDIATGTLGGINTLASKLGTIPTIVTTVVGAMTILNSKFRENVNLMSGSLIPGYTQFTNYLSNLRTSLSNSAVQQEKNIAVSRSFMSASQQAGMSTRGMATELVGMEAKLLATRAGMIACTVATVALQTALSMGVSLLATMAVTGLMNLANSSENARQKIEELSSSIKEEGNSISQSEELLKQKEDLESQISKTSEGTQQNTELKKQLLDVERQLSDVLPTSTSGFDSEGKAISADTDLIKAQIQAKKDKLAVDAQELISNAKDVNALMKKIELTEKQLNAVKLAQKQGKSSVAIPVSLDSDETQNIGVSPKYIADVEKSLNQYKSTISSVRLAILQLKQAGKSNDEIKAMFPNIDMSAINSFSGVMENNTNKVEENSNAKSNNAKNTKVLVDATKELQSNNNQLSTDTIEKLNQAYPDLGVNAENAKDKVEELNKIVASGSTDNIQKATQDYNIATQEIAKAQGFIDKLNKAQAVTPALAGQIAKKYSDIGDNINNLGSTIDFLKGKIQEEQEAQSNAIEIMKGDDSSFYEQKVANNEAYQEQVNNFLNAFVQDSEGAYNVDLSQFTTLNQMKAGVQGTLQSAVDSFLSQFVDTSSQAYSVDYANFTTLINAKKEAMKAIAGAMSGYWDEVSQDFSLGVYGELGGGGGTYLPDNASDETIKKYEGQINQVNNVRDKVRNAESKLDQIYAGGGLGFQGFSGGGGGVSDFGGSGGSGSGGKGSGGSGKQEKDYTEEIAKMQAKFDPDPYFELQNAIKVYDNELTVSKTLMESLKEGTPEYQKAQLDEIETYKKKQVALQNLNNEQKKQSLTLKDYLTQYGFTFDQMGNMINSQSQIKYWTDVTNAMTGSSEEDKAKKQEWVDWIKE